jgi:hypothetical protein
MKEPRFRLTRRLFTPEGKAQLLDALASRPKLLGVVSLPNEWQKNGVQDFGTARHAIKGQVRMARS